ncbi:MAG TPA: hypothetical protein VF888_00945 [Nitrospirota bacterium]
MRAMKLMGILTCMILALVLTPAVYAAGTSLVVTLENPAVVCRADGLGADVTAGYAVTSSGAADAAVMEAFIGTTEYPLPTIASGNIADGGGWTFAGRTKTAEGDFGPLYLANGDYTLTVCATQGGANGQTSKHACSTPAPIAVHCTSTDPCANEGAFGDVPANKNLCKANGNIEIQFKGNFGDTATLVIDGPSGSGFNSTVTIDKAGDSCNYHYNWDPVAGQPAGSYTFTVNGSLTFSADLVCDLHGK